MTTDLLRQQLAEVAERRAKAEELAGRVSRLQEKFDLENYGVRADLKAAKDALAESEANARALIVAIYETSGEKKPAEGATVRVSTKLEYDKAEAFAKAKAMGVALIPEALDVKAFEKIAKASPDSFPFVKVVEEPSATLASDLSQYLAPVGAPVETPVESVEAPF